MFLERNEKNEKYSLISNYLYIGTIVMIIFALLSNLVFSGALERYINWIALVLLVSGLIVEVIPDFLEKKITKAIFKSIWIIFIVFIWVDWLI